MGVPKRLTEMQKRFAELIVWGGPNGPVSQTEAAKLAGYSEKRAAQEGSELLNPKLSPLVIQYVDKLKQEKFKKFEVTYESHLAELSRIKEEALKKGSFSSAVNAETNRGKAAGFLLGPCFILYLCVPVPLISTSCFKTLLRNISFQPFL